MPDLFFNGVRASTGRYLTPPLSPATLAHVAAGKRLDRATQKRLAALAAERTRDHLAPRAGLDPKSLAECGWCVVFGSRDPHANAAIKEALGELLEVRRAQAGDLYRELVRPEDTVRPDESALAFAARHGAAPGPVEPKNLPYYVLLVGDPEDISHRFQQELDVQYAVGRIHFDTLDEYASYARSVRDAEQGKIALPRRAAFFGVEHPGDPATEASAESLVQPLATWMADGWAKPGRAAPWSVDVILGPAARKARLARLLGGAETPALLFTASHGLAFDPEDPRQAGRQGALVCQDWPGPVSWGEEPVPESACFAASDIGPDARLAGMFLFCFACFSAGTPRWDTFHEQAFATRVPAARRAFVAGLPRRALGHPRGGALAAIGHVGRAWGCSFDWPGAGPRREVHESALRWLLDGYPIGAALDWFNVRHATLSAALAGELDEIEAGKQPDPLLLGGLWIANNDARGFVVVGDPAVRMPVVDSPPAERRDIEPVPPRVSTLSSSSTTAPVEAPSTKTSPVGSGVTFEVGAGEGAVEVATLTSEAATMVGHAGPTFPRVARPRVVSRIHPDGGVDTCFASDEPPPGEALWARHLDMVEAVSRRLAGVARPGLGDRDLVHGSEVAVGSPPGEDSPR